MGFLYCYMVVYSLRHTGAMNSGSTRQDPYAYKQRLFSDSSGNMGLSLLV